MDINKPNILFIISDDHRYNAIGHKGNEKISTPNLDYLENSGVTFEGTHIMGGLTGAVCAPSRASVHTGANIFRSGGESDINPELALMPETLRENGYYTFAAGKWHNDMGSFNRSFCDGDNLFLGGMSNHYETPVYEFDPTGAYSEAKQKTGQKHSSELFAGTAIDFLRNYNREEPFFLYLAFTSPHDPRTAPESFHHLYNPDHITLPPNFMPEHPFDNGELMIRDEKLAGWPRKKAEVRQHISDYYAMISHMDAQISRVIEMLKMTGQLEETLIVYTADHGLSVGQHGLMGKQNMYDHSIRIPLIMSGPGLPKGKKIEALNAQIDIFPTLLDLMGLNRPETIEGISLLPLITEEKKSVRDTVYSVYLDVQRMVKNKRWKMIRYYHSNSRGVGEDRIQLFDLKEDPWETENLSNHPEYKNILEYLVRELEAWQIRVGDPLYGIPILPA